MALDRRQLMAAGAALFATPSIIHSAPLQKLTITYGGDGLNYFPIYLARGAGHFAAEGLEVDWVNVGTGSRQAASVMGGSAEMTPIALFHAIRSRAEGANLVALAPLLDAYDLSLVVSHSAIAKAGLGKSLTIDEKVRRLQGLKIGISSSGSSTDTFLRGLFLARSIDPDRFIQLQPLGNGQAMLAAFDKKLVDGFVYSSPIPELAEARGLGEVVINPLDGSVPELSGVPYIVMTTSRETLLGKPQLMKAATRALTRAMLMARDDAEGTLKVMRPFFPDVDPTVLAPAIEAHRKVVPRTPVMDPEQLEKCLAWMNLGAEPRLRADYGDVIAAEPARSVAKEMVKS